jgi:hypothetical protein
MLGFGSLEKWVRNHLFGPAVVVLWPGAWQEIPMSVRRDLNAGRSRRQAAKPGADQLQAGPEEQMTSPQASELKALAEEAGEVDAYEDAISASEAALRINALRAKLAHERANRFGKFRG